jgi:hypothetical protein
VRTYGAGARGEVKKRTAKPKKARPKKDQAWFEQKVSELGARLNKLPAARQEQLDKDLLNSTRR